MPIIKAGVKRVVCEKRYYADEDACINVSVCSEEEKKIYIPILKKVFPNYEELAKMVQKP